MESNVIIGVDLGGTNIRAGRVYDNSIEKIYAQKITSNGTVEQVVDEIKYAIRQVFDSAVSGIGIGVPSIVDTEEGIIYDVINIPGIKELRLKDILEDEFHIPVYVNNDANCFVAGEKYFGAGAAYKSIVGLVIGTGLGSGIYFDDKLYTGANCGAGEFGMISYKETNYEDYCSGRFFMNNYSITGEEAYNRALLGDKKALQMFSDFGIHIGNAISAIFYSYDPEIVILGGSLSKAFRFYRDSVYSVLNTIPYTTSIKKLKIEVSSLDHVAILGASALYYLNNKAAVK